MGRSYHNQFSLSPVRAALLGFFTLGIAPALRLSRAFRSFAMFERQQLGYLADWLRVHAGGEDAAAFADAVRTVRLRHGLGSIIRFGIIAFVLIGFATLHGHFSFNAVMDATYGFYRHMRSGFETNLVAFLAWNVCLSLAYLALWAQVALHRHSTRAVIDRFNAIAARHGVEPIRPSALSMDVNAAWVVCTLVLISVGALWSIPMMFAGASQRGYINSTSQQLRGQLMDRVRGMLMNRRPMVAVPSYMIHGKRCENGLCQATLPAGARYCPRCGSGVAQSRVA